MTLKTAFQSPSLNWIPHVAGILMLNIDTSYSLRSGGFGFVLRDSMGRVLISGAGPLRNVTSAEDAELLAMWSGFDHIREYRIILSLLQRTVSGWLYNCSSMIPILPVLG